MKYIKPINEINNNHKKLIMENDKNFTISYEIELDCINGYDTFLEMSDMFNSKFKRFMMKWEDDIAIVDDESLFGDDTESYEDGDEYYGSIDNDIYIGGYDNMSDIGDFNIKTDKFYKGLEIVPDTWFDSISDGYEFLYDFFIDYKKQKTFKFSNKTGLHINIGFKTDENINILKGYLMLNENYALDGWDGRSGSEFAGSFRKGFDDNVSKYLNRYKDMKDIKNNISKIITDININLLRTALIEDEKSIGFNLHKLQKGYIEFRYGGGKGMTEELIRDKTIYYSNIVMSCYDKNYRRKSYFKMLSKYLTEMFYK